MLSCTNLLFEEILVTTLQEIDDLIDLTTRATAGEQVKELKLTLKGM